MFKKYQHIERLGTSEVQGILDGTVHIFPKIDGTNASVWMEDGVLCLGSRNRQLSLDSDNARFMQDMMYNERLLNFFTVYPDARLYGEWLVPHSLKTYTDDAWRKFYVFDVMMTNQDIHCAYDTYAPVLETFGIDYIPCIAKITNPTQERLNAWLERNVFLVKDGQGCGEGVVIKNYLYINKHRRQTWAKIVTNEFKEKHTREMGPCEQQGAKLVEVDIVDQFCTEAFIEKTFHNLPGLASGQSPVEADGWTSRRIPELLGRVWHDFVTEETWHYVKKFKNPTVNYKTLFQLVVQKVKKTMPELFSFLCLTFLYVVVQWVPRG